MKKLFMLFVAFAAMWCVSCSDDDENIDKSPIKGLEIPPSTTPVKPGAPVTIKGEGFTTASEIWFRAVATRAEGGGDVKATVTNVSATGITFTTPMVFGNQSVLLKENGKEYELGEMTFEGQSEDVVILPKKVVKIIAVEIEDYSDASRSLFSYNADGKIISEGDRQGSHFNSYQYENNRIVRTGMYGTGSYELKGGKASIIKSEGEGEYENEEYTLSYNATGYLETVKCKWLNEMNLNREETETFAFINGYITQYTYREDASYHGEFTYEYGDFKQINNVNIDLWGVLGYYSIFESNIGQAFTLGVAGNRCKYLPIKLKASETGEDEDDYGKITTYTYEKNIEYVVNAAGYVTKITISDKNEMCWIFEIYYEQ